MFGEMLHLIAQDWKLETLLFLLLFLFVKTYYVALACLELILICLPVLHMGPKTVLIPVGWSLGFG